jgi:hypothetical protein
MTTLKFSFQLQTFKVCLFFSWFLTKYVSQNQNITFTWMFECQILRIISDPLSILLAIKAYPFGLTFELAPSFIDTYDNSFAIFFGLLIFSLTFRLWERSFTNHHTRLWFHHAIRYYTHQLRQEQTSLPLSLHLNSLKECIMDLRISSIIDFINLNI